MTRRARFLATVLATGLAIPTIVLTPAASAEEDPYSADSRTSDTKHQKAKGKTLKVTVKGLPRKASAKVVVTQRIPHKLHKRHKTRSRWVQRIGAGKSYRFKVGKGHHLVVGKPVKVKGTKYKANKAFVVVKKKGGVKLKLRYYKPGHSKHPSNGRGTRSKNAAQQIAGTAFPDSGQGSANGYSMGKAQYKKCTITWSYDPGPLKRLGQNPTTELNLVRGVFTSVHAKSGYDFVEQAPSRSKPATIQIREVDHIASAAGMTYAYPKAGDPSQLSYSTIDYDATQLSTAPATTRQNLYAHEIGHALGLDHTSSPSQIMNPTVPLAHGWGNGDLTALGKMPSTCR